MYLLARVMDTSGVAQLEPCRTDRIRHRDYCWGRSSLPHAASTSLAHCRFRCVRRRGSRSAVLFRSVVPLFLLGDMRTLTLSPNHLTNRWSQPLAVAMSRSNFMKQLSMLRKLASASGGSAPSR